MSSGKCWPFCLGLNALKVHATRNLFQIPCCLLHFLLVFLVYFQFLYHIYINTLRPWQNGCCFADDIFKCIILNENFHILIQILLKFLSKGPIDKKTSLVQIMAWHHIGIKALPEPIMTPVLWPGLIVLIYYVSKHEHRMIHNIFASLPVYSLYNFQLISVFFQLFDY